MTNENQARDPFDFFDLSDLPEELAGKLTSDTDGDVRAWADVVKAGAAKGHTELSINQIIAAATRMGLKVPTQTTVRNYLNRAVQMKLIGKPTRMTYGADANVVATGEATEAPAEAPQEEADPLAGL